MSTIMDFGDLFPEGKRLWYEADHSSPSKAESKNTWSSTFTAPYVFREWCLIEHRENVQMLLFTGK
jgi:hypothetical protein